MIRPSPLACPTCHAYLCSKAPPGTNFVFGDCPTNILLPAPPLGLTVFSAIYVVYFIQFRSAQSLSVDGESQSGQLINTIPKIDSIQYEVEVSYLGSIELQWLSP